MANSNNEYTKKAILETMASFVQNQKLENIEENVNLVIDKLKELSDLFDLSSSMYPNDSSYYSVKDGWNNYLYRIQSVENYPKALHLITEILDLVRGEPLILEVYKINRNDKGHVASITRYIGKESNVGLKNVTMKYNDSITEEVHFLKDNLEKQKIIDKAFLKHYENFENLAYIHFHKHEKEKKYANFNEGHIIEAYKRHIVWNNDDNYTDKLSKKHVAIMLYYSMNSTGWWKGGDIGYIQMKGNNTRLATQKSIRMVANKLIQMYKNPSTFTPEEFHKMFTANTIEEMAEYKKLSKKTLEDLLSSELKNLSKDNVKIEIHISDS